MSEGLAMDIKLGVFIVPDATTGDSTLSQIIEADRSGLDIVRFVRRLGEDIALRVRELLG